MYRRKINESLRQLKHNLECTNLVNMMYVLCTERRKCCQQKNIIEKHYKNELALLQNKILQKDEEIKKLKKEKNQQIREVTIRESCLLEVIKHFQKFINFALRASPTQAEFLLSVEKMMVFELTNAVAKTELPKFCEDHRLLPWKHEEPAKMTASKASGLVIEDAHKCFNEIVPPPPSEASQYGEEDILPAIHFKDKLYVREDFRDMLNVGIEVTSSSLLWNKDVEILIDTWKKQSADIKEKEKVVDIEAMIQKEEDENTDSISDSINWMEPEPMKKDRPRSASDPHSFFRHSKISTVQFADDRLSDNDINGFNKRQRASASSKKSSLCRSALKASSYSVRLIEEEDNNKDVVVAPVVDLLAAKDSIEIATIKAQKDEAEGLDAGVDDEAHFINEEYEIKSHKIDLHDEFQDKLQEKNAVESRELAVEARDSVLLTMAVKATSHQAIEFPVKDSLEVISDHLEKESLKKRPSKLSTTRDSVVLLKESLMKLQQPSSICNKKYESDNVVPQEAVSFAGTCCERCKRAISVVSEADQSLSDEKSVKISRVQIINLEESSFKQPSVVSFQYPISKEIKTPSSTGESTEEIKRVPPRKKIVKQTSKKKKGSLKTNQVRIGGDRNAKEGDQSADEFTADRIHSLINLMKNQPHLMQLFTAGSR